MTDNTPMVFCPECKIAVTVGAYPLHYSDHVAMKCRPEVAAYVYVLMAANGFGAEFLAVYATREAAEAARVEIEKAEHGSFKAGPVCEREVLK
jgi:hypothetical protein